MPDRAKLRSRPVLVAVLVSVLCCAGLAGFAAITVPVLEVPLIDPTNTPVINGDTSDKAWSTAKPVTLMTAHGSDFGGSGETEITVRALHDKRQIYFSFVWDDPTKSDEHIPLVKKDGIWHFAEISQDANDQNDQFDDRLAIMLAHSQATLIGGAIHLGVAQFAGVPKPISGRGFHYTSDGSLLDVWIWSAVANAVLPYLQDDFIGAPKLPNAAQAKGVERYAGGIAPDTPLALSVPNFKMVQGTSGQELLQPLRLPLPAPDGAFAASLSQAAKLQGEGGDASAPQALTEDQTAPYSSVDDALIPDGTIVPSVVVNTRSFDAGNGVKGVAKWAGGRWMLEISRPLVSGVNDVSINSGTLMWLAAFDHAQTRHTYHLRPLKLELENYG